ncbi:LTA synthase family protein [Bacillus sp. AL-1R]
MIKKSFNLLGPILIGLVCSYLLVIWSHNYLWKNNVNLYQNLIETDFFKWNFLIVSVIVLILIVGLLVLGYNVWWILITTVGSIGMFSYALSEKIKYTGEPFHPSDLFFLRDPIVFLQFSKLPFLLKWGGLLAAITFLFLGTFFAYKEWRNASMKKNSLRFLLIVSLGVFFSFGTKEGCAYFVKNSNVKYIPWNYETSVERYGMYNAFLVTYVNSKREEPKLSSKVKNEVIKELKSLKPLTVPKQKQLPDVLVIQSEAYSMLDDMKLKWNTNPNAPLLSIKEGIHGTLISNTFGGRTANEEFEILTSLKLKRKFENRTPYQEGKMANRTSPSFIQDVREFGMDPIALHPFKTSFFKRREVYPNIGFNQFLSETDLTSCKKFGSYISDECGSKKALSLINKKGSQFVFFVTMQNHFDWRKGHFPEENMKVSGVPMDEELKGKVESYASGIYKSGNSLVSVWQEIKKRKNPTIVLFYGDHRPTFGDKKATYEHWGAPVEKSEGQDWYNETPMWIWSNDKNTMDKIRNYSKPFLEKGNLKLESYEIAPLLMKVLTNNQIEQSWYDWVLQNHSNDIWDWVIYDRVYGEGVTFNRK